MRAKVEFSSNNIRKVSSKNHDFLGTRYKFIDRFAIWNKVGSLLNVRSMNRVGRRDQNSSNEGCSVPFVPETRERGCLTQLSRHAVNECLCIEGNNYVEHFQEDKICNIDLGLLCTLPSWRLQKWKFCFFCGKNSFCQNLFFFETMIMVFEATLKTTLFHYVCHLLKEIII